MYEFIIVSSYLPLGMSKNSNKQKKIASRHLFFNVNACYSLLEDPQVDISKYKHFYKMFTGHFTGFQSIDKDRYHSLPHSL